MWLSPRATWCLGRQNKQLKFEVPCRVGSELAGWPCVWACWSLAGAAEAARAKTQAPKSPMSWCCRRGCAALLWSQSAAEEEPRWGSLLTSAEGAATSGHSYRRQSLQTTHLFNYPYTLYHPSNSNRQASRSWCTGHNDKFHSILLDI